MTRIVSILALVLVACEGPVGPAGPPGPQGEPGERGIPGTPAETPEGVFIEVPFPTDSDYDTEGRLRIQAEAISPTTFRGLFVKVRWDETDTIGYVPLGYLVSLWVSVVGEGDEGFTPVVAVGDGGVEILDRELVIIRIVSILAGNAVGLAVLVGP